MFNILIHRWLKRPYLLHADIIQQSERPRATVVLLHGLGCTKELWQPLHGKFPDEVRVIALDLLGFGDSPKPVGADYTNRTQARAIWHTLRKIGAEESLIVVGHSLGSLAAIAFAAAHPDRTHQVIACGAPLYHPEGDADILKQLYELSAQGFEENKEAVVAAAQFLQKTGLAPRSLELNHQTIQPYIASLRASIIKQSLCDEVASLQVPSVFLCGRFDPLVRPKTLEQLQRANAHITIRRVMAAHGLSGGYLRRIARIISDTAGERA